MSDPNQESGDQLSVKEMQEWLQEQIRDAAKAHELRIKEATGFVTEYAQGKLTPEQALDRMEQYDMRWGEPLHGATAAAGVSDEEIVRTMDQSRNEHAARLRDTQRRDFGR